MALSASLERHSSRISFVSVASVIDQNSFHPLGAARVERPAEDDAYGRQSARLHPDKFISHAFQQRCLVRDHKNSFARIAHALEQARPSPAPSAHPRSRTAHPATNFRIVQNGPRQRHALPHALRILPHRPRQLRVEPTERITCSQRLVAGNVVEAARSSAGSPSRSSRRKAATDAPCSRCRGKPRAESCPEWKPRRAWDEPIPPARAAESSSLPRCRRGSRETSGVKLRAHAAQRGEAAKLLDQVTDGDDSGDRLCWLRSQSWDSVKPVER
jgi:hypothetical protein